MLLNKLFSREVRIIYIIGYLNGTAFIHDDKDVLNILKNVMASYGNIRGREAELLINEMLEAEKNGGNGYFDKLDELTRLFIDISQFNKDMY